LSIPICDEINIDDQSPEQSLSQITEIAISPSEQVPSPSSMLNPGDSSDINDESGHCET
jgi:hypothetical protein